MIASGTRIGLLSPNPDEVARAFAKHDASRLQPSGAYAANLLGLSEHVPAKIVFLTDGSAHQVRIGRQEIVLKRTTTRNMATAGRISGTIIQALRHPGAERVTGQHIEHLRQSLSTTDKLQLTRDRIYAPGWMHGIINVVAGEGNA